MRSRLLPLSSLTWLTFAVACSGSDVMQLNTGDAGDGADAGAAVDATVTPTTAADGGVVASDAGAGVDGSVVAGRVELNTDTIDFGPVIVNTTDSRTLVVRNPGTDSVRVTVGALSGRDAAKFGRTIAGGAGVDAFDIPGGGTVEIELTVSPDALGDLIATMALDSCFGSCPTAITLLATGVDTGVACPAMFEVGFANPGGCITAQVPCENRGNINELVTFVGLDPRSDPAFTIVEPALPFDFAGGSTVEIAVTFCPAELRPHRADLIVATFEPVDREHTIELRGAGGGPNVSCSPPRLDFGAVGVGAPVNREVTCSNDGSDVATVSAAFATGAGLSVLDMIGPISPGDSATFRVQVDAAAAAVLTDTLVLSTNDPDTPTIDIPITAEVIDVGQCTAMLSPTSRDFGLVSLGDAEVASFTITNIGMDPCLVQDATLAMGSDPAFSITGASPAGASLVAGDSISFEVTFAPSNQATAQGTVAVSFSNPNTAQLLADISGAGGTSELRFEPTSIDFGSVQQGCAEPARRTLTARNIGPDRLIITGIQLVSASASSFNLQDLPSLPAELGPFETGTITVTFDPQTIGAHTAEVRVAVDGQPVLSVLEATGTGASQPARTDTFDFSTRQTDLLFIVDDSCSMAPAQEGLAQHVAAIANTLTGRGVDFHFGVVTTDMNNRARSGRLIGMPSFLDAQTPDLAAELEARVVPGIMGNGNEQGILAARRAVTPPLATSQNMGFLRDAADLAIVIVSDEEDGSPNNPSITAVISELRAAAGHGALSISGITGGPTQGCDGPYGDADAAPRYVELIGRAGSGIWRSFCQDIGLSLRAIADHLFGGPTFRLSTEPINSTIVVQVNGQTVPAMSAAGLEIWRYNAALQSVVFTDGNAPANGATIEITYDAYCASGSCGDGMPDPGEACDDGNMSDEDACVDGCREATCGDGFLWAGNEACDDGNVDNGDGCLAMCIEATCGDGYIRRGVEHCDDGNTMDGDNCPSDCLIPQPPGYDISDVLPHMYEDLANPMVLTPSSGGMENIDDGAAQVVMPFSFNFYGVPTTTLSVSVNGVISTVGFGNAQTSGNRGFPDQRNPDGLIAPWWDDLMLIQSSLGGCMNNGDCDPDATCQSNQCRLDSRLSWEVLGNAPNREMVIEWRKIRHFQHTDRSNRRWSMQVAIEEGTSTIHFRYSESFRNGGGAVYAASSGIENTDGSEGEEALSCTPNCDARPLPFPNGFPAESVITLSPTP